MSDRERARARDENGTTTIVFDSDEIAAWPLPEKTRDEALDKAHRVARQIYREDHGATMDDIRRQVVGEGETLELRIRVVGLTVDGTPVPKAEARQALKQMVPIDQSDARYNATSDPPVTEEQAFSAKAWEKTEDRASSVAEEQKVVAAMDGPWSTEMWDQIEARVRAKWTDPEMADIILAVFAQGCLSTHRIPKAAS